MIPVKALLAALMLFWASAAAGQSVLDATLMEPDQRSAEVSTRQLREILDSGSAIVLDARPPLEFAISHIPGALNVAPQPDRPAHLYVSDVAEVGRLVGSERNRPLVLYCNGPFCGKSRRLANELLDSGFTNVRRYQLGTPGWRALSGRALETELAALDYIGRDSSAVWIDARDPVRFTSGSIRGARNIPASELRTGKDQGVMRTAKDDGRLPMDDHNTRIIVFGSDGNEARRVADAIASEAFHNVTFLGDPFEAVRAASPRP